MSDSSKWKVCPLDTNYKISQEGEVFSLKRNIIMKGRMRGKYRRHNLGGKTYSTHRLVAETFIPNPQNFPVVNHVDGNSSNNKAENLEWTTHKKNSEHSINLGLRKTYKFRPVSCTYSEGNTILFESLKDASKKVNLHTSTIYKYCQKTQKCPFGQYWEFTEVKETVPVPKNSKPIPDFPSYTATEDGKIYSKNSKQYMKTYISDGYPVITLRKDNKPFKFLVHSLIALTFLGKRPKNLVINHIDGNKLNTRFDNLEYVTSFKNVEHAFKTGLNTKATPVAQLDPKTEKTIAVFGSITDASKLSGIGRSSISDTCRGVQKTAGKFIWKRISRGEFLEFRRDT